MKCVCTVAEIFTFMLSFHTINEFALLLSLAVSSTKAVRNTI